jgi:hypothetical protein
VLRGLVEDVEGVSDCYFWRHGGAFANGVVVAVGAGSAALATARFRGAADFDLELIDSRTLDGNIQELIYRPTLHA